MLSIAIAITNTTAILFAIIAAMTILDTCSTSRYDPPATKMKRAERIKLRCTPAML
jgi:hypothetical protein